MILAILAAGCASKPKTAGAGPGGGQDGAKEPGPVHVINSGKVELREQDEEGNLLWVLHGESSVTTTQEGGTTRTELDVVDGEIYENGVVVSRFRSDKAFANDKDKSIEFSGRVSVNSEKQKATLTADTVAWNDPEKLYDARGDVRIKSSTYEARAERLLADAKLKKIATPNLFKK